MAIDYVEVTIGNSSTPIRLNYDSASGTWSNSTTAPNFSTKNSTLAPDGYVPVSITAYDTAGNHTTIGTSSMTFGENLKLRVEEKDKPVIAFTSPSSGSYQKDKSVTVEFTVKDNNGMTSGYSGVNSDSIVLKDGSTTLSGVTKTAITGGYRCTYTGNFTDGVHTLTATASDNDDNAAEAKSVSFTVDTVKPNLTNVKINDSSESTVDTNQLTFTITGNTDDAGVKTGITVSIAINGVPIQGTITPNSDGSFSKTISVEDEGSYTITITATDMAGNDSTTVSKTVNVTTTAPIFELVSLSPNPATANGFFTITVKVR